MADCLSNNLIPLDKAISAALMDAHADVSEWQSFSHWAARRFKTLARQSLKTGKRYASLHVNKNTNTATLPPDFKSELFVGYINGNGYKVGLPLRTQFTNAASIEDFDIADACPSCKQVKSICDELTVTEEETTVLINGNPYKKTVTKKLYANGNYYLETSNPYYNTVTEQVEYAITKEFIDALALKECGCLENTTENIEKVRCCCPEVYGNYYTSCTSDCDTAIGGYRIMENVGLIQLDRKFTLPTLYLEYTGFLPKINGQLAIPEIAFESVVKGTVIDAIAGKRNIGLGEKQYHEIRYRNARSAMDKEMGLVSLNQIMQAISLIPKFDVSWRFRMDTCGVRVETTTISSPVSESCASNQTSCNLPGKHLSPFSISFKVGTTQGAPVASSYVFQNNDLIGAVQLDNIVVDNNNESLLYGDFTFDDSTGTITRINPWQNETVGIIPFAKFI